MFLDLEWSSGDLGFIRSTLNERAFARALRKAGSSAILALRAEAKRQVRQRSPIKAKFLAAKSLPIDRPRGSSIPDLIWTMRVSGQGVPLSQFPNRQTKKGVNVEVLRGHRKLIKSAFLALAKRSGGNGVFLRPGKERYPMGHRLGPRVSDLMDERRVLDPVFVRTQEVFKRDFDRLLPLELKAAAGKARFLATR